MQNEQLNSQNSRICIYFSQTNLVLQLGERQSAQGIHVQPCNVGSNWANSFPVHFKGGGLKLSVIKQIFYG